MHILREENENIHIELDVLKGATFDQRTADVAEDNKRLKRRNGELQIELIETKG